MSGPFAPLVDTGDGWVNRELKAVKDQQREVIAATGRIIQFQANKVAATGLTFANPGTSTYNTVLFVAPAGFSQALVQVNSAIEMGLNGSSRISLTVLCGTQVGLRTTTDVASNSYASRPGSTVGSSFLVTGLTEGTPIQLSLTVVIEGTGLLTTASCSHQTTADVIYLR